MGVDVESLTPGDGMWTVNCCNKASSLASFVGDLVSQTRLHSSVSCIVRTWVTAKMAS